MATLDRWRGFLDAPKAVQFKRLELIGWDHEPSVVVGTGEVRMTSLADFEFTLTGTPTDIGYALTTINRAEGEPYNPLARCRLLGTDQDDVDWNGGWTIPRVEIGDTTWTFTGEIDSLVTMDRSSTVSPQASTELIFSTSPGHLMALALGRFARTEQPSGGYRNEHELELLGSNIRFTYDSARRILSVTASHSADLPHPFAENWLGEPFRLLFGQLIFPRLVARNMDNGRAHVWVRPSPGLIPAARWAALWEPSDLRDKEAFWSCYGNILSLIARARDDDGQPNFEAHKVTRLYQEIIQAARGSRWVWALTFSSSIEALAKLISEESKSTTEPTKEELESKKAETEAMEALVKHIYLGPGEARLKQIAVNAVRRDAQITTIKALRRLKADGVITGKQLSSWEAIRHAVMHGSLVSPYSTEEEDARLLELAAMMHALTREVLRRSAIGPAEQPSPQLQA
jgi:hypothetical protein